MPDTHVNETLARTYLSAIACGMTSVAADMRRLLGAEGLQAIPTNVILDSMADLFKVACAQPTTSSTPGSDFSQTLSTMGLDPRLRDADGFELMHYIARQDVNLGSRRASSSALFLALMYDPDYADSFWSRDNVEARNGAVISLAESHGPQATCCFRDLNEDDWYDTYLAYAEEDISDAYGFTALEYAAPVLPPAVLESALSAAGFNPAAHSIAHMIDVWCRHENNNCPNIASLYAAGIALESRVRDTPAGDILVARLIEMAEMAMHDERLSLRFRDETFPMAVTNIAWLLHNASHVIPVLTCPSSADNPGARLMACLSPHLHEPDMLKLANALSATAYSQALGVDGGNGASTCWSGPPAL